MHNFHHMIIATVLAVTPFAAVAQDLTDERIKELALEAIRENPSIILEAMQILEQQQAGAQASAQAQVLQNQRDLLEKDPNAPVLGNPEGDVTVIEFFDYNCPYCKRAMPEVQALLDADPDVRLVYREWPILGEGSVFAAKAALAARKQGKYEEFHWALMGLKGRVEESSVISVAKDVGLDVAQLRADMDAPEVLEHIATTTQLAQALGFNGTPSFVIGDDLLPGLVEQEQLQTVVDKTRDNG